MEGPMRRRAFLVLTAAMAAPLRARAQGATPVVGWLSAFEEDSWADVSIPALRKGLEDSGFIEGHNILIAYRWADGHYDRLTSLAAELVRQPAAVIIASDVPS